MEPQERDALTSRLRPTRVGPAMNTCSCSSGCADCSERVLCACLQITEANVKAALVSLEIRSIQDLREHTGAGDGCTACHRVLRGYIAEYAQSASAEPICSVK